MDFPINIWHIKNMKHQNQILKAENIITMSDKTRESIKEVAEKLKGKELFPDKIKSARAALKNINSLSI